MLRIVYAIRFCLLTLPDVCESAAKHEVATITDVRRHEPVPDSSAGRAKFDVSIKVKDSIYAVLYTDPMGMDKVRYAAGRELLAHVGEKTITHNDMFARSQVGPIINQKPAATTRQSN